MNNMQRIQWIKRRGVLKFNTYIFAGGNQDRKVFFCPMSVSKHQHFHYSLNFHNHLSGIQAATSFLCNIALLCAELVPKVSCVNYITHLPLELQNHTAHTLNDTSIFFSSFQIHINCGFVKLYHRSGGRANVQMFLKLNKQKNLQL